MEKQDGVVIKKTKKVVRYRYHIQSWKVAYADFVTAMMAFFLLMWLVTVQKTEDKIAISEYFKEYNVTKGEKDIQDKIKQKIATFRIKFEQGGGGTLPIKPFFFEKDSEAANSIIEGLKDEIRKELAEASDQVLVGVTDDGAVMMQLVDKEGKPMFPPASSELTPAAKKALAVIWEKIKGEDIKIAIEGHTDAYTYSAGGKSNWELSTERASAARRELERLGLPPYRLIRVTGLADTKPISSDPYSPTNRRISLLVYYFLPPDITNPPPTTPTREQPPQKTEKQVEAKAKDTEG